MYLIFLLLNFLATFGSCIVNFCDSNTFISNSTFMQMSKEASKREFAVEKGFKGLHCCAKGYRSIEWYKDGRPYPWPAPESTFILYPASANQTIYTQTAAISDSGNYTCLLRNDTHIISHMLELNVVDKIPDLPQITYRPVNQQVVMGQRVRVFCEAFVGRAILPDAKNNAIWIRKDQNETLGDGARVWQEIVEREDGLTLGVYLHIHSLQATDLGEYICKITKPDSVLELSVSLSLNEINTFEDAAFIKMAILFSLAFLLMILVIITVIKWSLNIRILIKRVFGKKGTANIIIIGRNEELNDRKDILTRKLEEWGYKCVIKETGEDVNLGDNQTSSIIAFLPNNATRSIFNVLTPNMNIPNNISVTNNTNTVFLSLQKQTKPNVSLVFEPDNHSFWLKLKLKLPNISDKNNKDNKKKGSRESLQILV